ncbi:MAG: hypothetical protein ABSH36_04670, partial [Solirubrobacteraceae bacterium]
MLESEVSTPDAPTPAAPESDAAPSAPALSAPALSAPAQSTAPFAPAPAAATAMLERPAATALLEPSHGNGLEPSDQKQSEALPQEHSPVTALDLAVREQPSTKPAPELPSTNGAALPAPASR